MTHFFFFAGSRSGGAWASVVSKPHHLRTRLMTTSLICSGDGSCKKHFRLNALCSASVRSIVIRFFPGFILETLRTDFMFATAAE